MIAIRFLAMPYLLLTLSGCSVAMALSGHQEPNFEAFEVGSSRKQVEIQLGAPTASRAIESGQREDAYEYEMGNSPNGHRALLNVYIDLATFLLAEPILTCIEFFQGHKERSVIVYTAEDRVAAIQGYKPPPISEQIKADIEAHKQWERKAGP